MVEKSIMKPDLRYSTERFYGSHRHEIFYGNNRKKSIELGLYVFLEPKYHNMSKKGVHFDKEFDLYLKQKGQKRAMEVYGWDIEQFIKEFGKNYLTEEDNE